MKGLPRLPSSPDFPPRFAGGDKPSLSLPDGGQAGPSTRFAYVRDDSGSVATCVAPTKSACAELKNRQCRELGFEWLKRVVSAYRMSSGINRAAPLRMRLLSCRPAGHGFCIENRRFHDDYATLALRRHSAPARQAVASCPIGHACTYRMQFHRDALHEHPIIAILNLILRVARREHGSFR